MPVDFSQIFVGTARVDITPMESVWLAGYAARDSPSSGVLSRIYVRVIAFGDLANHRRLIISIEQMGIGPEFSDSIAAQLNSAFEIARDDIVIACTHSHTTPVCDLSFRTMYEMPDLYWERAEEYGRVLRQQIFDASRQALDQMQPARIDFGQGLAGFGVNRRRARLGCRHLPGPVDPDVPILRATTKDGRCIAIIFGYACHTTTLSADKISGDYAGFAAHELEQQFSGAVCAYIPGCGADINPLPRSSELLANIYGHILSSAIVATIESNSMIPITEPLTTARIPLKIAYAPIDLSERDELLHNGVAHERRWAELWSDARQMQNAAAAGFLCSVQLWQWGNQLSWIQLPAECTVDYAVRFKSKIGWENAWVSAYCDAVNAYIPSERVLDEGGYEAGGSKVIFGLPAPFAPGIEQKVTEAVGALHCALRKS